MSKRTKHKSTPKGLHLAAYPPKWERYCWREAIRSEFRTDVRKQVFEMCERTRVIMEEFSTEPFSIESVKGGFVVNGWVEPGFDPSGLVVEVSSC